MAPKNQKIVIIDDDVQNLEKISEQLGKEYEFIKTFSDHTKALDNLHTILPDVILLNVFIGHTNGLDILELIKKQGYTSPVIMMAAPSDIKMAVHAIKMGAEDFILKPINFDHLNISIHKAINNNEMKRRVELLSEELHLKKSDDIIGDSIELQHSLKLAASFAKADTTVLIYGESGTGKELVAKYIHNNSSRAGGPFITINCGAIPRELAENELFGYERGAFTGAIEKIKQGKFEQANHGTILFDEISELSLDLQVKLLRVLQERKYFRLGGSKEISVDVRVIASTNKDLEPLVQEGKFREDLYYRLNVAKLRLPPLRERGNDIMLLATAFVAMYNKEFIKSISGFDPLAANTLTSYPWRGNIRELKNAIERVVLLEENEVITNDSLEFLKHSYIASSGDKMQSELSDGDFKLYISKTGANYNKVLKDLIIQTLKLCNADESKTAKYLGLTTLKLSERISQLDIEPSDYK